MKLTPNFSLSEFGCKDGTAVPQKYIANVTKLAKNLQVLRDHVKKPVVLNSAYRSPAYNRKIGGAPASQHLTASASDIRIAGMTSKQVHATILQLIAEGKMHNGGLGLYNNFVHYDIRSKPTRWDLRK